MKETFMQTRSATLTRRQAMQTLAAAGLAASAFPLGWSRAAESKARKVLFFTKSSGFQHDVVNLDKGALAEKTLTAWGKEHGFDVTATKDGSLFTPEKLAEFDLVALYTTGDLDKFDSKPDVTKSKDGGIPMPPGGYEALQKFVESGKGLVGFHCAADTFNHHGDAEDQIHPYIKMIGAEFETHGKQQPGKIRAVKQFAPLKDVPDFELTEEWYRFKNISPDLHVILVQETAGMDDTYNKLKPYPETWARLQGKGRVFYTSLGHREDVWTNPLFHQILLGGMSWAAGNVEAEFKPNLMEACPGVEKVRTA
jgi:type 1 glutamine amidotransferase